MANGKIAGLLAVLLGAVAALGIGLVAAQNSGVEVRIEARRLDDGRVEFALRERGGERILPRARYFPAETEAGRWLNASWITVGEGREFSAAPTPTPTATQERTTPFEGVGRNYATTRDDFTDEINTGIFASIDGKYSWSEDTRLMVLCAGGQLYTAVSGDHVPISDLDDEHTVLWRVDSNPAVQEVWVGIDDSDTSRTRSFALYNQMRYGQSVAISITGWLDSSDNLRFNLEGMFDTPAQWNIDNCGNY